MALLARLCWGARISLAVGLVATLVSLVIGVSYGAVAGYLGGSVGNLMMRIIDVLCSIPFIFVVIFLITILSTEPLKQTLEDYGINRIMIFFLMVGAIYWRRGPARAAAVGVVLAGWPCSRGCGRCARQGLSCSITACDCGSKPSLLLG